MKRIINRTRISCSEYVNGFFSNDRRSDQNEQIPQLCAAASPGRNRLDANGWADVAELIERARSASVELTESTIRQIVASNDKQRFAISEDGKRIRANQRHSVDVDLALKPQQPPEILYHGTASRFLDSIRREGLKAMSRQHVHLSPDEATAIKVGQRHGKPVVLRIRAREMAKSGAVFYLSDNGVWFTERVGTESIEFPAS